MTLMLRLFNLVYYQYLVEKMRPYCGLVYPLLSKLILFRTNVIEIPLSYENHLLELNVSLSKHFKDEPYIKKLPTHLTKLKKLFATLSMINEIPDTYINLEVLYLHQSNVDYLNPKFINIEILDCSETPITIIPKEYVKLIELSYSHDDTFWDSSWYKDDDDMIFVERIQKWFLTKKYIKSLANTKDLILNQYKEFVKNKKAIILQKWIIKTIKYFKYIKSFQKNKKNNRIENIIFLQYNIIQCLIYKYNIRYINYYKNSILTNYQSYSRNKINNAIIIQKWFKKHKFISNFCKNVKKSRNSYIRSYKYYLRNKINNNLSTLIKTPTLQFKTESSIEINKPIYNYDFIETNKLKDSNNKLIKFFKTYCKSYNMYNKLMRQEKYLN